MAVKNIYRIIYILLGLLGIMIQMGIFSGTIYPSTFVYYTTLSNLLCIAYFTLRFMYDNKATANSSFRDFIMQRMTKYSVTMCITLTFLIFHFLLAPTWDSGKEGNQEIYRVGNYIVHYIIPVMTIIDFFIFDRSVRNLPWYTPFVWLMIPAAYFAFILIRAPFFGNIGDTSSPYPYEFMDLSIQPVTAVMSNVLIILAVFIAIGYIFLLLDNLIRKITEGT